MKTPASVLALTMGLFAASLWQPAIAQNQKLTPAPNVSTCTRDGALEIVGQQIDATKTFDEALPRITVLLRAADLLWPYQKNKARTAFSEAFDQAATYFKEKGDEPTQEGRGMVVDTPDQRYLVVQAIARRDQAWAKKLTDEILKMDREAAVEATTKKSDREVRTAWRLLESATLFLSSDLNAATTFASASLSYPASLTLTMFILNALPKETQANLGREAARKYQPQRSFGEQIDAAEKERNPDIRDSRLVSAILRGSNAESVDHVLDAVAKSPIRICAIRY